MLGGGRVSGFGPYPAMLRSYSKSALQGSFLEVEGTIWGTQVVLMQAKALLAVVVATGVADFLSTNLIN